MAYPLPDDNGSIDFPKCREELEALVESATVIALGPGLGQSKGVKKLVRWVVESVKLPTVIDADGLNVLAEQMETLQTLKHPVILTPHPKEFSRLTGKGVDKIQSDRSAAALELAAIANLVVVLKGSQTVVSDGNRLYVNTTGNPGMATGGSGDVLGGVIAALIGQKLDPFDAAVLGVHAHGLAGDIARDQSGEVGLIAGDIVDSLADAFYHLGAE